MIRATLLLLLTLALSACVPPPPPGPPIPPAPPPLPLDACGAVALQGLVGRPARVLETMRFGTETRIIRPGMAVTMDFRAERLDIEIDSTETISRVFCG